MPNTTTLTSSAIRKEIRGKRKVRPTWEMADLFPKQGSWSEDDYLELTSGRTRVELVDGFVEFLEMPSIWHDRFVKFLFLALNTFVTAAKLGEVFIATTKTKLRDAEIRMPDVLLILNDRLDKHTDDYFFGADLVMEVVSPDSKSRKRDLMEKRSSYADAQISEYWIIDPELNQISVLKLAGGKYEVFGEFKKGQKASSALLAGFEVDVTEALAGRQ